MSGTPENVVVVVGEANTVRRYILDLAASQAGRHSLNARPRIFKVTRMDDAYRLAGLEFDPDIDELVTLHGADPSAVEFVETRFRRRR